MELSKLRTVVQDQRDFFFSRGEYVERDVKLELLINSKEIIVISGIRRSGKSTLLRIIADRLRKEVSVNNIFYLNFDDERLVHFTPDDFAKIMQMFLEKVEKGKYFFLLDEIQNISYWEKWVNRLYEQEGIKVFVTGSNASLLSSEIATSLTGRNITIELYPFSFREFLRLRGKEGEIENLNTKQKVEILKEFSVYLNLGSFPQVIKSGNKEFLKGYFNDILYRDIVARFSLRDVKEIKELAFYLASNLGKPLSYNNLANITGIKSVSTVKNYLDYFQQSFFFFKLRKFAYSVKKQLYNPAKNYIIDVQLAKQIGFAFSEDKGRLLENIVFISLKRRGKEIFYHQEKNECDFIVKEGVKVSEAIQVCNELHEGNKDREVGGLLEALRSYKLKKGLILTENQEEDIKQEGFNIDVVPLWKWLLR